MNFSKLSFLLFTLGLILIISHAADAANSKSSSGGSKLIDEVCNAAMEEDRASCLQVLRSDPKISSAKNYLQLSQYILELALQKGIQGQNFLKEIAKTNKSPAIQQCAGFDYDGVVGSFSSALGELKEDPETANYDAKVAGDGPETCERGLADEHIVNPSISSLNKNIKLLSTIAFLATNHL